MSAHFVKPLGSTRFTLGYYTWHRKSPSGRHRQQRGISFRLGPLGHFAIVYAYRRSKVGRRPLRDVGFYVWPIHGRRRKIGLRFGVVW